MGRRLKNTVERLIELSAAFVETILLLKHFLEPKSEYWCGFVEPLIQDLT